jgi:hypothetical protein
VGERPKSRCSDSAFPVPGKSAIEIPDAKTPSPLTFTKAYALIGFAADWFPPSA